ncbi:T-cell-interacting, activating receptor on myeloid cells protein 1-like [Carettochelys insculpta]|uniref:T-cell-interacting, activating receptor on myeloid cells protein 1-like n=1 Tax=Carettochelys insculpta TaxID=44489 RepID=UPI003EBCCCD1
MASALTILFLGLPWSSTSISTSPSGVIALGTAVTIRCQCQCWGRRLFVYKDGSEIRELDTAANRGEFTIPSARQEDTGDYHCLSRAEWWPFSCGEASDPVRIIVADTYYPKPSISLHPSGGVAPGGDVTVQCQCRHQNMKFLLYKDGNPTALQAVKPDGTVAEFPIRSVSQRDAGSYRCYYCTKSSPPVWSYSSDSLELVVAELSYPKASIFLHPSGVVAPGGAVTLHCECWCQGAMVLLNKAGDSTAERTMEAMGDVAEFHFRNVSRRDAGSYSCQYSTQGDLPGWSEPSDPVELVVAAVPTVRPDFTHTNIARLVLSALVLLILGLILTEAYCSLPRGR